MSDIPKKTSAKKSTLKKSSSDSAIPLKEVSPSKPINQQKIETSKTEVEQLTLEFETIAKKFDSIEDPINRYIARLDMREIQEKLKGFGINVNVP